MSTTRFRISLAILACLVLGFLAFNVGQTLLADHDGWDIVAPVTKQMEDTELLIIEPDDLLSSRDQDTIRKVVQEARDFGIPWSVAVVRDDTANSGVSPEDQARFIFEEADIESRPDADDGLLMAVIIPEDEHTATSVHFVTGDNFYPKGGITPERLQWIAEVQMAPIIADNNIGDAVIEGATWVEWMQLFMPKPDPASTNLQDGLQDLLDPLGAIALAAIALLVGSGAITVAWLTRRGSEGEAPISLDPIRAGALANGRVDHRVLAGIVLDAIQRGMLLQTDHGLDSGQPSGQANDTKLDQIVGQAVITLRDERVKVTPARLVRYLRTSTPLRQHLEDELANAGYLEARSYRFRLALRIAAAVGVLAGFAGLVLSVAGEVESTLAAAIALTAISIVALIWNESRSWTTDAGSAAVKSWLERHQQPDDLDRLLFETIRRLDDVSDTGTIHSDRSPLLASLRFQG